MQHNASFHDSRYVNFKLIILYFSYIGMKADQIISYQKQIHVSPREMFPKTICYFRCLQFL